MTTEINGTLLLLVVTIVVRALGTAIRGNNHLLPIHLIGWGLCLTAAWIGAGVAGAWFPLWPALVLGVVGGLVDCRLHRRELWIGADIVIIVLAGLLSIPPLEFGRLTGTVVMAACAGFVIDSLLVRSSKRVQTVVFVLPFVAFIAISIIKPSTMKVGAHLLWDTLSQGRLLYIGLTPVHQGERVVLETGAVAWLEHPTGEGPFPGALLFHGANPDGSMQPAAIILRRALLNAGYVVLSVDHPGYGESPAPSIDGNIDAWDPLPTALAALKRLRSTPAVDEIFVLGHSMGAREVLRLLGTESKLTGAVVFGASMHAPPSELTEYWYERFHIDRRIPDRLAWDHVVEIRTYFYDDNRILETLDSDHAPILFVRFEFEWPDIVATRDSLYEAIPGRKMTWDLVNSTHYFSSDEEYGLVIGDTRITRLLTKRLYLFASEQSN